MKVEIKRERCKECGLCIHHCPKKAISKIASTLMVIILYRSMMNIGCGILYYLPRWCIPRIGLI